MKPVHVTHSNTHNAIERVLQKIDPTIDEKDLRELAENIQAVMVKISSPSSTPDERQKSNEQLHGFINNLPWENSQLFAAILKFREKTVTILDQHQITPDAHCSSEMGQIIEDAAVESAGEVYQPKTTCGWEDCNNTESLKKCGRCRQVMYCSREHQKFDWNRHRKVECIQK